MRYFIHIGFNGTNYRGWQKLREVISVQETLETALCRILKIPVNINGCGRTDAQVHASQFFFHIDVEEEWEYDLKFRLNKTLPHDIAVFDIIPMPGLQHARFDATHRTYDYFIHTYKDPFLHGLSSFYPESDLDLNKMRQAVDLLPKYNDYRAFCRTPNKYEHTICNVSSTGLYANRAGDKIRFQITSNRFLTGMIRIIVGKLLQIGRGNLTIGEFESYLISKQTPPTIIPAYPQGLYLSKVTYPYLNLPSRPEFSAVLQNNTTDAWIEL